MKDRLYEDQRVGVAFSSDHLAVILWQLAGRKRITIALENGARTSQGTGRAEGVGFDFLLPADGVTGEGPPHAPAGW